MLWNSNSSNSSEYQRDQISQYESLLKKVGAKVPEVKPQVNFLQRLGIILDTLGGGIRAGVHAAQEGQPVWPAVGKAIISAKERPSGAHILETAGVTNKYAKAIGGFALEMVLDPISYIGSWATKGTAIFAEDGTRFLLNQKGMKMLSTFENVSDAMRAERTMAFYLKRSPSLVNELVDKGGLKYMGMQTPLTTTRLAQIAQATGIANAQKWMSQTALGKVGTAVSELITPGKAVARQLAEVGMGPKKIRDTIRLFAANKGVKLAAMASNTDYYRGLVRIVRDNSKEIGIATGITGKNQLKKLGSALMVTKEMPQIADSVAKKFGGNWDTAYNAVYSAALDKGKIEGLGGAKLIRYAQDIKESYINGKNLWNTQQAGAWPKSLQKLYSSVTKTYKEIGNIDEAMGTIAGKVDNYLWRGTRPMVPKISLGGRTSQYSVRKLPERSFSSLLEVDIANNWTRDFDFLKGVAPRGFLSDINQANLTFANHIATMAGVPIQEFNAGNKMVKYIPPGWVDASTLRIPGQAKTFTGLMVPNAIAKDMVKAGGAFLDVGEADKLIEGLDWYMNQWKSGVTVWWPAFHIRNAISNVFNASYLGGANPTVFKDAMNIQIGLVKKTIDGEKLVEGTRFTINQIMDIMQRNNLRGFGQVTQALQGKAANRLLDVAVGDGNSAYNFMRTMGSHIEENAKLGSLIDRLRKGDTIEAAVTHVKKYLFDYSDLTDFEQKVMKRVIPFYTWMRKNIPLQVGELLRTPGKYTGFQRALDAANNAFGENLTPEEQSWLPDFAMSGLAISRINLGKDKDGKIKALLSLDLPYEDLADLTPGGFVRKLLSSMAPPLKYVIEEISGKDFFRDKTLEDVATVSDRSGILIDRYASSAVKDLLGFSKKTSPYGTTYRVNPRLVHLLAQLPVTRGGSTLNKFLDSFGVMTDNEKNIIDTALSSITGMNIYRTELTDYFNNQSRIDQLNKIMEGYYPQIKKYTNYYIPKK